VDLTLNAVATHTSNVRYQASSDEEDLVLEHTDHEFRRSLTSQGMFVGFVFGHGRRDNKREGGGEEG
jgi:hypothetical protein